MIHHATGKKKTTVCNAVHFLSPPFLFDNLCLLLCAMPVGSTVSVLREDEKKKKNVVIICQLNSSLNILIHSGVFYIHFVADRLFPAHHSAQLTPFTVKLNH
jgi:hypothetical protein